MHARAQRARCCGSPPLSVRSDRRRAQNPSPIWRVALESSVKRQNVASRFAKTIVYWPYEQEHAEESAALAWTLILSCLVLGIIASFENVFLGIALAALCLHGSALARYLITR